MYPTHPLEREPALHRFVADRSERLLGVGDGAFGY